MLAFTSLTFSVTWSRKRSAPGCPAGTREAEPGAYKVVGFKTDESVELEAFDQYHGGAPKIKRATVRIVPDSTTMVLELRRGTINLAINQIPFENVGEFEKSAKQQVIKKPGSVTVTSAVRGLFRTDARTRQEAMSHIGMR